MTVITPLSLRKLFAALLLFVFGTLAAGAAYAGDESREFKIKKAEWRDHRQKFKVEGEGRNGLKVTVFNALDPSQVLGRKEVKDGKWKMKVKEPPPDPVPCRIRAVQSDGKVAERDVEHAPSNCAPKPVGGEEREFKIKKVEWRSGKAELRVEGEGANGLEVTVRNAFDLSRILGKKEVKEGKWKVKDEDPAPVPCRVRAEQSDGRVQERDVKDAPADCAPKGDDRANVPPAADANGPYTGTTGVDVNFSSAGSNDPDGTIDSFAWDFGDGGISTAVNPSHAYAAAGTYTVTLTVTDSDGASDSDSTTATITNPDQPPVNVPPTAVDDSYETPEDIRLNVDAPGLLGNDSDDDGDALTAELRSDPVFGTVTLNADGSFSYTPAPGFSGSDSFIYRADDGRDAGNDATVTITVTRVVANRCPDPLPTTLPEAHELCTTPYTGPEVCVQCHEDQARDMHGSVHYQQNGATDFVTNIDGLGGERGFDFAATGMNTYCGTHENSPRFTCAGCHVGNGRFPMPQSEFEQLPASSAAAHEQLANIDCLTCHQERYRRFPDWINTDGIVDIANLFEPLTLENVALDANGDLLVSPGSTVVRTGLEGIPVVDPITLDFEFAPAGAPGSVDFELPADSPFAPMSITTEVAAQTVHLTTRRSCLSCHAGAAGANGAKRGDLTSLLADPDIGLDMHMSPAGQDLTCSDCHTAVGVNGETHRVRGRGVDLRPNDVPERFTCENGGCHDDRPHGDFSDRNPARDTHALKVACQTCHIPTYGKGIATEVARDWEDPHLSQSACNGRGGWLPREDKGGDLIPSYVWYDGDSEVYFMGESLAGVPTVPLAAEVAQRFVGDFSAGDPAITLALPTAILAADGTLDTTLGVTNPGAKLQAMKEHWGKLARHDGRNTLIGHSTFDFFRTGDFDLAVRSGMEQSPGMSSGDAFSVVAVHTYQSLNHGVEVKANALDCNECHKPLSGNARIDLGADFGYGLRTGTSAVTGSKVSGTLNGDLDLICSQCHGNKTNSRDREFTEVHNRHVNGKRRDCASCHDFSRLDVRAGLNLNN